jgi:hypothetical protein
MGLDMYLEVEVYIGCIENSTDIENTIKEKYPHLKCDVKYISFEAGYWRKANAIHRWFVENVQNGKDDCRKYPVHLEELEKLKSFCEEILADNTKADKLLPAGKGFFFGSYEYDDWYFSDLKKTVEIINNVLDNPENEEWNFYYRASW